MKTLIENLQLNGSAKEDDSEKTEWHLQSSHLGRWQAPCKKTRDQKRTNLHHRASQAVLELEEVAAKGTQTRWEADIVVIEYIISPEVVLELRVFNYQWPSVDLINKKLKLINPELSSHSFGQGLIRLNRDLAGDADVMESYEGSQS